MSVRQTIYKNYKQIKLEKLTYYLLVYKLNKKEAYMLLKLKRCITVDDLINN